MRLTLNQASWPLLLLASGSLLTTGCFEKGKGKGSRQTRPDASGSIFDDGDKNQKPDPVPPGDDPDGTMDPEAQAILAACFNLDPSQVVPVVGWTDKTVSKTAADALCAKLDKTGYKLGILNTTEPVAID